ncbi:MAG: DUF523 and DUF1722 domain-containing protein [Syntrophobacteraceae bacterium]|nr:DUF523 and DUF1722 domain-containing protein [Syntrophobacteraceae bacterium]
MNTPDTPVKLGISSCLLGNKVRFDGGHKLEKFLTDTLGRYVHYVPVCPEVEYGLPIPREALRLVGVPESPRLITSRTSVDHTDGMLRWARDRVKELEKENLCGFIFKSRSPSSGMERVKIYDENGVPANKGVGIFAGVFMDHFPLIPVEEDGRLHDPLLRENFIERIFTLKRWRETAAAKKSRGSLVDFHTKNKLLILSHSPKHFQLMGKLVAKAKDYPPDELHEKYVNLLMEALKLKATPAKNSNVLQHMMGYFKKELSGDEKQELLETIQLYREGHYPFIVPMTLMNHYVRKYDQTYLKDQVYLTPHPVELRLRNHA